MFRGRSWKFLKGRSRESESEILESRSRKFLKGRNWIRIFYLRLRNPDDK